MKEVCFWLYLVVINDVKLCKIFDVFGGMFDMENIIIKFLVVMIRLVILWYN